MIVLIDSGLGAGLVGEVASRMTDATVWSASTVRSMVPYIQADQVLKDLYAAGDAWDAAVGLGFGCGPAAALVRKGRAERAVLIDPAPMLTLDSGLDMVDSAAISLPTEKRPNYAWIIEQHEPGAFNDPPEVVLHDIDAALEFAEANAAPFEAVKLMHQKPPKDLSRTGPYPREAYAAYVAHIYGKQVTDDPSLWQRVTTIWKEAAEAREPYDQSLPFQPDQKSQDDLNWLSAWTDPQFNITIWLSASHHCLAAPLTRRGPDRPLIKQPWNSLVWLTDPQQLADSLAAWPK